MPEPFALKTADPTFDPREPVTVNGYRFVPAATNLDAVRDEVAKLYCASGCSCCRDCDGWDAASEALGDLLSVPKHHDGSGRNWRAVRDQAKSKESPK